MKRFQIMLAAAVVFAVGSAFTTVKTENPMFANLYWFKTNATGTTLSETSIPDVAEPISSNRTGCSLPTAATFCGRGYDDTQTELNASGDRVLKSSTAISSGVPVKRN